MAVVVLEAGPPPDVAAAEPADLEAKLKYITETLRKNPQHVDAVTEFLDGRVKKGGFVEKKRNEVAAGAKDAATPSTEVVSDDKATVVPDGDKGSWMKASPPPANLKNFKERKGTIKDTAEKGLTLSQLQALGNLVEEVVGKFSMVDSFSKKRYTWETINLYGICSFFVMPLTKPFECAFVELMATSAQVPLWFISHWWGTPFHQSLRMLSLHHKTHNLDASAPYWMCTFANNQHKLEELGGGIPETPFVRVLQSEKCQGTIALMDKDATPFTRIWCILEAFETTKIVEASKKTFRYEIGIYLPEGQWNVNSLGSIQDPSREMALILTEVVSNGEGVQSKVYNDGGYDDGWVENQGWPAVPDALGEKALKVDCRNANASNEQDKKDIMAYIGSNDKKDALNTAIRKPFVPFAMCSIVNKPGGAFKSVTPDMKKRFEELTKTFKEFISLPMGAGGQTPLHFAIQDDDMKWAAEMLIEAKADIDAASSGFNGTPLIACLRHNYRAGVELLVKAKVDPNKRGLDCPDYPIHLAQKCGDSAKIAPLLIELGADVNVKKAENDNVMVVGDGDVPEGAVCFGGTEGGGEPAADFDGF